MERERMHVTRPSGRYLQVSVCLLVRSSVPWFVRPSLGSSVRPLACLSVSWFVYPSLGSSILLLIRPSVRPSVSWFVRLSARQSDRLPGVWSGHPSTQHPRVPACSNPFWARIVGHRLGVVWRGLALISRHLWNPTAGVELWIDSLQRLWRADPVRSTGMCWIARHIFRFFLPLTLFSLFPSRRRGCGSADGSLVIEMCPM